MIPFALLLLRYSLVVDAGETGSRIAAFCWNETASSPEVADYRDPSVTLPIEDLTPLAQAFRDRNAIKNIFDTLLASAKATIPTPSQSSTPVLVLGTSGMRALEAGSQADIMTRVYEYLKANGTFAVEQRNCRVLSTREEAAFEWVAANSVLELFGAATTAVFSISSIDAHLTSEIDGSHSGFEEWLHTLTFGAYRPTLFVGAFDRLGVDEVLPQHIVKVCGRAGSASVGSPCFQTGWKGDIQGMSVTGTGHYNNCYSAISDILTVVGDKCPKRTTCMFAGLPRPPFSSIVGLSTLFYTRDWFGLGEDANLSAYESVGRKYCAEKHVAMANRYAHLYCFYAAYIVNFLRRGLGLTDESKFRVMDSHDNKSISFSRGAVLSELSPAMEPEPSVNIGQIGAIVIMSVIFAALIGGFICCCVRGKMTARQDEERRQALMQDWDGDGEVQDAEPEAQEGQQQPQFDFLGPAEEHHVDPVLQGALEKIEGQVTTT
jgi:hypothetical protein